jgi:hypothetical protein
MLDCIPKFENTEQQAEFVQALKAYPIPTTEELKSAMSWLNTLSKPDRFEFIEFYRGLYPNHHGTDAIGVSRFWRLRVRPLLPQTPA